MSGKFEIFLGANSQFYFRLKASNGRIILQSEGYTTKDSCKKGISSVKTHAPFDKYYNREVAVNGQYYFTLKSVNNQIIGSSETYTTVEARENGINSVKTNAPDANIDDQTV